MSLCCSYQCLHAQNSPRKTRRSLKNSLNTKKPGNECKSMRNLNYSDAKTCSFHIGALIGVIL